MSEKYLVSLNINGKDVQVSVNDLETANILLNDSDAALAYVQGLSFEQEETVLMNKPECNTDDDDPMSDAHNASSCSEVEEVVWSKRKPSDRDNEATSLFLIYRLKFHRKFDDKKTNKNKLWSEVAGELRSRGFSLGSNSAERCRQKFSNLLKTYLNYIKHQKTTGEAGGISEPPFFDELHAILGSKHKANPVHLEDSIQENESQEDENTDTASSNLPSDRFKTRKNQVKPVSTSEQLLAEMKQDREQRDTQFNQLMIKLNNSEQQKERFLQILEKAFSKKTE